MDCVLEVLALPVHVEMLPLDPSRYRCPKLGGSRLFFLVVDSASASVAGGSLRLDPRTTVSFPSALCIWLSAGQDLGVDVRGRKGRV